MTFNTDPNIPYLIPFNQTHILKTFEWIKNPAFRKLFLMRGTVLWRVHQEYFQKVLSDPSQIWYAIISDGTHVGNCGIRIISAEHKESTLWIYIGDPAMRGKGIGTLVTRELIKRAFCDLYLSKIFIHVAAFNKNAIRMYKNLGFKEIPLGDEDEEWLNRECKVVKMKLTGDSP